MNVRPFRDCLLVHRVAEEQTRDAAIDVSGVDEDEAQQGSVLAVAGVRAAHGKTKVVPEVKVGDQILFGKHSGTEIRIDGQAVLVVREDQVLAILAQPLLLDLEERG
jgi:chaperonin GroES